MLVSQLGWLAALAPALSRASPLASPSLEQPTAAEVADLIKRQNNAHGNVGKYAGFFPDCSIDPSYSTGTSQYKDGDGAYVESSCDNGLYTPAVNRFHCWTDLFAVTTQASYQNWKITGQTIDCAGSSSCNEVVATTNLSCTIDTTTWDNKFGVAIQAQFPIWKKDVSVSPTLSYDHNFGGSSAVQICTTTTNQGTCTYTDKLCHAVWSAQRNIQVNGYLRRSCNTNRSGTNVPNSPKRADGYYTVGMQDINFQVPENSIIGCAAMCGSQTYPDPVPGPDQAIPVN